MFYLKNPMPGFHESEVCLDECLGMGMVRRDGNGAGKYRVGVKDKSKSKPIIPFVPTMPFVVMMPFCEVPLPPLELTTTGRHPGYST